MFLSKKLVEAYFFQRTCEPGKAESGCHWQTITKESSQVLKAIWTDTMD